MKIYLSHSAKISRIFIHEVTHERKKDDTMRYFPHLYSIRGIGLKFADRAFNLSGWKIYGWKDRKIHQKIKILAVRRFIKAYG